MDKFVLHTKVDPDQWYLEDPFDLAHNLAHPDTGDILRDDADRIHCRRRKQL